jgi:hypothetical protein
MAETNITELKNLVKPDVLSCPDPIVNREVLTVILEFCKKTNVLQREFQLDIDSNDIDTDIQNCVDFDISEHSRDLRPVTILSLMIDSAMYVPYKRNIRNTLTDFGSIDTGAGSTPDNDDRFKFYWVPNNHTIRVFDMAADMSTIYFNIAVKPLRDATTIDSALFEDWSEAIVAGAKHRLLKMPAKAWTDLASSLDYKREYRKFMSQAKKAAMSGGTSVHQENIKWKAFSGGV